MIPNILCSKTPILSHHQPRGDFEHCSNDPRHVISEKLGETVAEKDTISQWK